MYFGRVYELTIGLEGGEEQTFGGIPGPGELYQPLNIVFSIDQTPNAERARAEITIYGIAKDRRKAIYKDGDSVNLVAGWKNRWRNDFGSIFNGFIRNVEIGRSGPDVFVKLFCESTIEPWASAEISRGFTEGTPMQEVIRATAESFGFPVEMIGDFSGLPNAILGYTPTLEAKSEMRSLRKRFDFTWLITNGVLYVVKDNAEKPDVEPIEYRTMNGLIGSPEITEKGVNIEVLLNPLLQPWDTYTVASETGRLSVNSVYYDEKEFPKTTGESTNQIISLRHEGNFYGDTWQTSLEGKRV